MCYRKLNEGRKTWNYRKGNRKKQEKEKLKTNIKEKGRKSRKKEMAIVKSMNQKERNTKTERKQEK